MAAEEVPDYGDRELKDDDRDECGTRKKLAEKLKDYSRRTGKPLTVKVICLGDSAVGKSKLVERFLMDKYQPQQLSTYALTLYRHEDVIEGCKVLVDFWDTAGQERFKNIHQTYYHQAHSCIFVFDITRKITYKNLKEWLKELRDHRPNVPSLCAANKIDHDYSVTNKSFQFPKNNNMPFYFVSAADGTNVVKVFKDAIFAAVCYKLNTTDFEDLFLEELQKLRNEDETKVDAKEDY